MIPKISALAFPYSDSTGEGFGLPLLNCEMVPLFSLYSPRYWMFIQAEEHDVIRMDPRHWYYDDETYQYYVERLASLSARAVLVFDSPFTYEKPVYFPDRLFEDFVARRAEILYNEFKKRNSKAKLISPAVSGGIGEENEHRTVAFLVNHHSLFDAIAVHCFGELAQRELAHLSKLLGNVLSPAPKPVWVTHWCVSAGSSVSKRPKGSGYLPLPMDEAARRLIDSYRTIDIMCHGKTVWFYAGLAGDIYAPELRSPSDYADPRRAFEITKGRGGLKEWDAFHFLGLISTEGIVKDEICKALKSLE